MQVDWPGLLKWSLQYTDGTRPNGDALPKARPKEDLDFLERAIASAMGSQVDVYKLVKESAPKLNSVEESEVLAALGLIQESLDIEPELARNLHKLDLVDGLVRCLKHTNTLIQETDASILAFALANNEVVQKAFFEAGLLDVLMQLLEERRSGALEDESTEDELRLFTRLFGALSALIKHQQQVEAKFLNAYNGMDYLRRLREQTRYDRLIAKLDILIEHFEVLCSEVKNPPKPLALM